MFPPPNIPSQQLVWTTCGWGWLSIWNILKLDFLGKMLQMVHLLFSSSHACDVFWLHRWLSKDTFQHLSVLTKLWMKGYIPYQSWCSLVFELHDGARKSKNDLHLPYKLNWLEYSLYCNVGCLGMSSFCMSFLKMLSLPPSCKDWYFVSRPILWKEGRRRVTTMSTFVKTSLKPSLKANFVKSDGNELLLSVRWWWW